MVSPSRTYSQKNPPDDKKTIRGIQKNQTYIFNSLKLERVYSS